MSLNVSEEGNPLKAKNNKNIQASREQKKNAYVKSVQEIIQENHDLLLDVFQGEIPRQKLRLKIEQQFAGWQFKENPEDEKKHLKLYRVSLLLRLENIRQSLRNPNISDNKKFFRIFF